MKSRTCLLFLSVVSTSFSLFFSIGGSPRLSSIAFFFESNLCSLLFGLAIGAAFLFVGTQMKGKERAQPLLIASLVMAVFFLGRFWASPAKELFPSGILAALR
jgi:hypothetical protein